MTRHITRSNVVLQAAAPVLYCLSIFFSPYFLLLVEVCCYFEFPIASQIFKKENKNYDPHGQLVVHTRIKLWRENSKDCWPNHLTVEIVKLSHKIFFSSYHVTVCTTHSRQQQLQWQVDNPLCGKIKNLIWLFLGLRGTIKNLFFQKDTYFF